ncbi:hypothetical protein B0H16DRAFT_164888 [Mycena metata]|uniref:Secreted protein n=1 Tax=Mycena metata TaxID=1033252 RepID=A0AAD7JWL6_9AGAR|nr:hypothetical protein B0H16DRAFT_164888 [Mycena metata]
MALARRWLGIGQFLCSFVFWLGGMQCGRSFVTCPASSDFLRFRSRTPTSTRAPQNSFPRPRNALTRRYPCVLAKTFQRFLLRSSRNLVNPILDIHRRSASAEILTIGCISFLLQRRYRVGINADSF